MENVFFAFLDYEKTFDTVHREFLDKCLNHFGFPNYFKEWISIMYTDIESCIINNGFTTPYFPLKRGVRQGCPLSALLFIMVAEVLACAIRDKSVKGIDVNNTTVKVTQLADDMTIIVKDIMSLQLSLNIINMFYQASGLKLNYTKTEILATGRRAPFYTKPKSIPTSMG